MRVHYRVIVVAQVGNRASIAARALEYADALPVSQQPLVKIVDDAGVLGEKGLQKRVGVIRRDFFAD